MSLLQEKLKERANSRKRASAKPVVAETSVKGIKANPVEFEDLRIEVEKEIIAFTNRVKKIGEKADIILDVAVHIQPRDHNEE